MCSFQGLMHIKCLARCLLHSMYSMNANAKKMIVHPHEYKVLQHGREVVLHWFLFLTIFLGSVG